jgi:GNAT superfamily N-acetyltransferase
MEASAVVITTICAPNLLTSDRTNEEVPVLPVVVEQVRPEVTYDLRARVLRPGRPPIDARFTGDAAPDALHYAAYAVATADAAYAVATADAAYDRADRVVGVVAIVPEAAPDGAPGRRLRGMAVHPDERGEGVGRALLIRAFDGVARLGGGLLWCQARLPAAGFYTRAGFAPAGEPWEDPQIGPHLQMRRIVTDADLLPSVDLDSA